MNQKIICFILICIVFLSFPLYHDLNIKIGQSTITSSRNNNKLFYKNYNTAIELSAGSILTFHNLSPTILNNKETLVFLVNRNKQSIEKLGNGKDLNNISYTIQADGLYNIFACTKKQLLHKKNLIDLTPYITVEQNYEIEDPFIPLSTSLLVFK